MEAPEKCRVLHVTHPETIAILLNVQEHKFISPFMRDEYTVAEIAEQLGLELQLVYRKIKRLERNGLIRRTRTITRSGRPMHVYHAVAESFFASAKVLPLEQASDQVDQYFMPKIRRGLADTLHNACQSDIGTRFFQNQDRLSIRIGYDDSEKPLPTTTPIISIWKKLQINHQSAEQLKTELEVLLQKYDQPNGKDEYLLHLELAPLLDEVS